MYGASGGSAVAVIIANAMKMAPNPIIRAIAQLIALGGVALGRSISNANKGNGVYLRFTGRVPPIIYTGVFPQ